MAGFHRDGHKYYIMCMIIVRHCLCIWALDIDEEYLRPLLTWDSEVAPMEKLKAKPLDFASIHKDIRDIHNSFDVTTNMGDFHKIGFSPSDETEYQHVYAYRHNRHLVYSNVTTTMMGKLCHIQENQNYVEASQRNSVMKVFLRK